MRRKRIKSCPSDCRQNDPEIILAPILELPQQGNDAIIGGSSIPEIMLFRKRAEDLMTQ